jgi:hypothetical protein
MRRRLLASSAVLAALVLAPASARADVGGFIPAEPIDGPAEAIHGVDLDVARDGTGAVVYVKSVGGVGHVFASRLQGGAWQPPEQLDAGLAASSQAVVAAGDGGKLAVAFVSGGSLFAMVKPAADQPYTPPQLVSSPAINPSIDLSINDVAYLSFTNPAGGGGGDVVVARKDRKATAFGVVPTALDIDPAAPAGLDTGRSKVAVAADGVALVVWGESGQVFARRVFERTVSAAPQPVSVPAAGPFPGSTADVPDVDVQDDSSFAWVVFRQVFLDAPGGHSRALARRLVGSQFDPPVAVDGLGGFPSPDSVGPPRVDISGRGDGYAASASSVAPFGAVLKDKIFNAGVPLGAGVAGAALPVAATDENGDGLVAWQNADQTIHARAYTAVRASRAVQAPQPEVALSAPAAGLSDAADGLEASADRAGDIAVAFVLGAPGAQGVFVGSFDRAPGAFRLSSGTSFRNAAANPLKWSQSFELWGPLTYSVEVDGRIVGTTTGTSLAVPAVPDGVHRWRVIATDRRGQVTATSRRILRQDATPPRARVTVSGTRRRGQAVKVSVRPTDANPAGRPASGVGRVQIAWGDGSRTSARRGTHRYRRGGKLTLRVSVRDRADNVVVVRRAITIR